VWNEKAYQKMQWTLSAFCGKRSFVVGCATLCTRGGNNSNIPADDRFLAPHRRIPFVVACWRSSRAAHMSGAGCGAGTIPIYMPARPLWRVQSVANDPVGA